MIRVGGHTARLKGWISLWSAVVSLALPALGFGELAVDPGEHATPPYSGLLPLESSSAPEGAELMEYRTPHSRTYQLEDGTYRTRIRAEALNRSDANGTWRTAHEGRWSSSSCVSHRRGEAYPHRRGWTSPTCIGRPNVSVRERVYPGGSACAAFLTHRNQPRGRL